MGKCGQRPRKFTLQELANLPLNGVREMGEGCGPAISGVQGGSCYAWLIHRGFGWPNNGEFAWPGYGSSCPMCSDVAGGYGCACSKHNVGGKRGRVKRIAYKANKTNCCVRQPTDHLDGGYTCDPVYLNNYDSADCDGYMESYCKSGKWQETPCLKWVAAAIQKGRIAPNNSISEWCSQGKNFTTPACQSWCRKVRDQPGMQAACDSAVEAYCTKNNPSDPLCTCLLPIPIKNVGGKKINIEDLMASAKVCWYKPCKELNKNTYIYSNMEDEKKNCVSTACLIDAGDISVTGQGNKIEFKNSCASNLVKPSSRGMIAGGTSPPSSEESPTSQEEGSQESTQEESLIQKIMGNKFVIFGGSGAVSLISVFCLMVIIIIAIIMIVKNKQK